MSTLTLRDVEGLTKEQFALTENAASLGDALVAVGFQRCGCGGVSSAFMNKARALGVTGAWLGNLPGANKG
jgi:hypothetical protein